MATDEMGMDYPVAATVEALDPSVLAVDPSMPGRFIGKAVGKAQVRATYQGQEAYAEVTVSGERFINISTGEARKVGAGSFVVAIDVMAAASEGPLEYRVYRTGEPTAENWLPAQPDPTNPQYQRVTLQSPMFAPTGMDDTINLTLEARSPANPGDPAQKYPLPLRWDIVVKQEGAGTGLAPPMSMPPGGFTPPPIVPGGSGPPPNVLDEFPPTTPGGGVGPGLGPALPL